MGATAEVRFSAELLKAGDFGSCYRLRAFKAPGGTIDVVAASPWTVGLTLDWSVPHSFHEGRAVRPVRPPPAPMVFAGETQAGRTLPYSFSMPPRNICLRWLEGSPRPSGIKANTAKIIFCEMSQAQAASL